MEVAVLPVPLAYQTRIFPLFSVNALFAPFLAAAVLLNGENGSSVGDWPIHLSTAYLDFEFDFSRPAMSPSDVDPC
jgi:hypothetical protein